MDIGAFAERIVMGTTLEEKLAPPGRLTLSSAAQATRPQISRPCRPAGMEFSDRTGPSSPPSDRQLENDRTRGQLLHFLANHELLATELMAFALWKFPDAPESFRRGVLVTLQEEQEHTRLYLKRMEVCGVELGSYPLSGHFWRVVAPMETPMDFVARLSLTFEQANLDYSLHFASQFRRVHDHETADILEKIYQDEIGHVKHGLQWFREWKAPTLTDWEAYCGSLEFPMSPQRARGPRCKFNREGRRLAGLDERFIDAVEVYRQSRGRPPVVRWFDAGAESELSLGEMTSREQQLLSQLSSDLELAMLPLAQEDDVQLVRSIPSIELRRHWIDSGLEVPEFLTLVDPSDLAQRKLAELRPWAWTPTTQQSADELTTNAELVQDTTTRWLPTHRQLFSKTWLAALVDTSLQRDDTPHWMEGPPVRRAIDSVTAIEQAIEEFSEAGYSNAILKPNFSTSGRGQRRLSATLTPDDQRWLASNWMSPHEAAPTEAILEPELDRILDLSFLWDLTKEAPAHYIGWTRQIISPGRRYAGTHLRRPLHHCAADVRRFLLEDNCRRLQETQAWLEQHVLPAVTERGFRYMLGVDAFVHRDPDGALKIHPAVEINPRMTMGHVALALRNHVAPAVQAEFRILTRPEWLSRESQLRAATLQKTSNGRWSSGVVFLADVRPQTKLIPMVLIGDAIELLETSTTSTTSQANRRRQTSFPIMEQKKDSP